jgi:hypothetical protein
VGKVHSIVHGVLSRSNGPLIAYDVHLASCEWPSGLVF